MPSSMYWRMVILDVTNALFAARFLKIDFRKRQLQSGGRVADDLFHFIPIFGLGGELVTGDDRPFGEIRAGFGKMDFRNLNAKSGIIFMRSP